MDAQQTIDLTSAASSLRVHATDASDTAAFSVAPMDGFIPFGPHGMAVGNPGQPIAPNPAPPGKVYLAFENQNLIGGSGDYDLDDFGNPLTWVGISIVGENSGDLFGYALAGNADVNNDGFTDLLIGAPGFDSSRGRVYILLGGIEWMSHSTVDMGNVPPQLQNRVLTITGQNARDQLGYSLDGIPGEYFHPTATLPGGGWPSPNNFWWTFDTDTIDDLIIGAPGYNGDSGAAYIVYGDQTWGGTALQAIPLDDLHVPQDPSDPQSTRGRTIIHDFAQGRFGERVRCVFNVGDGASGMGEAHLDVAISAPNGRPSPVQPSLTVPGEVWVFFGMAREFFPTIGGQQAIHTATVLSPLSFLYGRLLVGESKADRFGFGLASAGDFNGDFSYYDAGTSSFLFQQEGLLDIAIGAPLADSENGPDSGKGYIIYGFGDVPATYPERFQVIEVANHTDKYEIIGEVRGDQFGYDVGLSYWGDGDPLMAVIMSHFNLPLLWGAPFHKTRNAGGQLVNYGAAYRIHGHLWAFNASTNEYDPIPLPAGKMELPGGLRGGFVDVAPSETWNEWVSVDDLTVLGPLVRDAQGNVIDSVPGVGALVQWIYPVRTQRDTGAGPGNERKYYDFVLGSPFGNQPNGAPSGVGYVLQAEY